MLKGISYFIKFSWLHKKQYLLSRLCLEFVKIAVTVVDIVLPKYILNALFEKISFDKLGIFIGILLGVNLLGGVLQHVFRMCADNSMDEIRMCFEEDMMQNHMNCEFAFLESPNFQNLKQKAKQYVNGPFNDFGFICERSFTLLGDIFTLMSVVYIVIRTNLFIMLVFILLTAVNAVVGAKVKNKNMNLIRSFAPTLRRRGYYEDISKNPAYAKEIRTYGITDFILGKYDNYMEKFCTETVPVHRQNMLQKIVVSLMSFLQQAVAYAYLLWQVTARTITAGDFTMYINAVILFNKTLNEAVDVTLNIKQFTGFYEDFEKYRAVSEFETENEKKNSDIEKTGEIEFNNVTFTYPGQKKPALINVSVKIPYGQKISVIGENGAGKSTFIKLLLGLYKPDEGSIMFDGVDIREINSKQYKRLFSAVFQDFQLFKLPIKDNILIGDAELNSQKIKNALMFTGMDKKIEALPLGIDTQLFKDFYNDGIELSGGEAQKLAVSRAYYKEAPFCVLDEPTAALDPKAESSLYENFGRLAEGKTMLFVSHRLSNARSCDRILVFKDGMISEDGNHDSLIQLKGDYFELYTMQAGMYS